MGAVLSFFRPAPVARGDWSQQELAEFYRVEAALTQSGLHVASDRGLSDENDPWFVFCRFDGEVILHFARIDGQYIVASEAFEHALRGPDFRVLLNAVAAEHPTLVPLPRPDANGRRGNLIMHPAALLAAIVASVAFQLAGGDAVAGELASDAPTVPMQAAAESAGASGLPRLIDETGADRDDGPRTDRGDEDRYAQKQVLVLSVMALIGTTLPTDNASGPADRLFAETQSIRSRDQSVSIPAAEKTAAFEEGRAQAHDASTAELSAMPTTSGPMASNQPGQLQAHLAQTSTGMTRFDFGTVDDREHLAFHLLNNAAPAGAGHQPHAMLRLFSFATSAEKAVPTGEAQASAAVRDKPGDAHAEHTAESSSAENASAGRKMAADVPSGTESGGTGFATHGVLGIGGQANAAAAGTQVATSQALSGQATSANATSTAEKAAVVAATWSGTASAQAASSAPNAGSTTNATIRTALNSFIDQQSTNGEPSGSSSLTAVDLTSKIKVLDLSVLSSAKGIGTKLNSDVLSTLNDGAVGASKAGASASTSDQGAANADPAKAAGSAQTASPLDAISLGSIASGTAKALAASASANATKTLDTSALSRGPVATESKALDKLGAQLLTDVIGTKALTASLVGNLSAAAGEIDTASSMKGVQLSNSGAETDIKVGIVGTAPEVHHGL